MLTMQFGDRMALDINDLWDLRDEGEWLDALDRYWLNLNGHKSDPIEDFINTALRNNL